MAVVADLVEKYESREAICDSAADSMIEALIKAGLPGIPCRKQALYVDQVKHSAKVGSVRGGIALIRNRLEIAGDERPRLTVDPFCVNLIEEMENYHNKQDIHGNYLDDEPVKEKDHLMDATRYVIIQRDSLGPTLVHGW